MDLDRRALLVFNRLRPMHLFRSLRDEQLVELTRQLERETRAGGEAICVEGQAGSHFYIIDRGRVRLTASPSTHHQTLEAGDFFGAEAALGGAHPYTATALGEAQLLRLPAKTLAELLQQHSACAIALQLTAETRAWLFGRRWEWLGSSETVYLIIRRHTWLLWQSLFLPIVAAVVVAVLAGVALTLLSPGAALWTGLLLGLPAAGWIAWVYVDWGNDFYLVTSQRVVYVEKVALIYDSRNTVSMSALTAVGAGTENLADRLLEYGDVTVKTLSKPLVMRAISYPQIVAALITEHLNRSKTRVREGEVNTLKAAIRDRIAPPMATPRVEPPPAEAGGGGGGAAGPASRPAARGPAFFSLQLRYDQGDTIIYRKHWWLLIRDIWVQSAFMLATVGLAGLGLAGFIPAVPLPVLLLVALVLFIPLALWWLYEFQDWRNDLYQVTQDQIIDIYRRPLGRETRDSASLENIQGLRAERPTWLSRMLNYGNVIATIPGKEFTFDDVYDPPGVQEDIQRRIEALKLRKNRQNLARQREDLAEVLSAYYLATKDVERNDANQKGG